VRVLIGTTNPAKIREHRALLGDLPIELVALDQVGTPPEVEENGLTFAENALIKARAYAAWSGLATLADDGGLAIDALNGEPGVRSKRWIDGRESSDEQLIAYTLERLRGLPIGQRGAAMKIAVALVTPSPGPWPSSARQRGHEIVGEGEIRGYVPVEASPRRDPGFPFRSVFKVAGLDKYYLDLTPEEHERFNHRRQAVEPIRAFLSG